MEKCVKISGRVQGVGFRFWAMRLAHRIGNISGYACNLSDGDVLVLMSGEEQNIAEMMAHLYNGPLFARVDNIVDVQEMIPYLPPIENGVFKRI